MYVKPLANLAFVLLLPKSQNKYEMQYSCRQIDQILLQKINQMRLELH